MADFPHNTKLYDESANIGTYEIRDTLPAFRQFGLETVHYLFTSWSQAEFPFSDPDMDVVYDLLK